MKRMKSLNQGFLTHPIATGALLIALAGAAIFPAIAAAQAPSAPNGKEVKVAVIDVQKILTDSNEGKQALAELKKLSDGKMKEARSKQVDITDLRSRIAEGKLSLSEDKLNDLEKQLEQKVNDFQQFQQEANKELQGARDKAFNKIEQEVMPIINQVGEKDGYTLIFNKYQSGLLYAPDAIDITDEIVKKFNDLSAKAEQSKGTKAPAAKGN